MRRDWDFLREIMIDITNDIDLVKKFDNTPLESKFLEHLWLLTSSELLVGIGVRLNGNGTLQLTGGIKPRLTMDGHDLLSILESQTVWAKVKQKAKETGISLSIESIKTLGSWAFKALTEGS